MRSKDAQCKCEEWPKISSLTSLCSILWRSLNVSLSQITCSNCSHESFKYQAFTFLSVPLLSESYNTFGKYTTVIARELMIRLLFILNYIWAAEQLSSLIPMNINHFNMTLGENVKDDDFFSSSFFAGNQIRFFLAKRVFLAKTNVNQSWGCVCWGKLRRLLL